MVVKLYACHATAREFVPPPDAAQRNTALRRTAR